MAGGVLAGREAEVSGEVATGSEAADIADEGNERCGGEHADAGDGHEADRVRLVTSEPLELVTQGFGFVPELFDLGENPLECTA